jgi:tripartite-type tricarboxylate transporter receptor subunit TctC
LLPEVPTVAEAGVPDYVYYVWFGLWAPKQAPKPVVEKLYGEVQKALANPDVKRRVIADGGTPMGMPLPEIEPFVKLEIAKWADVIHPIRPYWVVCSRRFWCGKSGIFG